MNHTTKDLLDYLLDRYGGITAIDIYNNTHRFHQKLDVSQPIATYFKTMDDCIQFADSSKVTFTDAQILQTALYAVEVKNEYVDGFKAWKKGQVTRLGQISKSNSPL